MTCCNGRVTTARHTDGKVESWCSDCHFPIDENPLSGATSDNRTSPKSLEEVLVGDQPSLEEILGEADI